NSDPSDAFRATCAKHDIQVCPAYVMVLNRLFADWSKNVNAWSRWWSIPPAVVEEAMQRRCGSISQRLATGFAISFAGGGYDEKAMWICPWAIRGEARNELRRRRRWNERHTPLDGVDGRSPVISGLATDELMIAHEDFERALSKMRSERDREVIHLLRSG